MQRIEDFLALHTNYTILIIDGIEYIGPKVSAQCKKLKYKTYIIQNGYVGEQKIQSLEEQNCLTKELWTYEKNKYCCENQGLGCSTYLGASGGYIPTPMPESHLVNKLNMYYDTSKVKYKSNWSDPTSKRILDWWVPEAGVLASVIFKEDDICYNTNITSCSKKEGLNYYNRTIFCPPTTTRGISMQNGRITSFTLLSKYNKSLLFNRVFRQVSGSTKTFMIYKNDVNMDISNIFCYWNADGVTQYRRICPGQMTWRNPEQGSNSEGGSVTIPDLIYGIGCGIPSSDVSYCDTLGPGMWNGDLFSPLSNFQNLYYTPTLTSEDKDAKTWNEVIVKSWNYDSSGPTKNGWDGPPNKVIENGSNIIVQGKLDYRANSSTYGWSDVSQNDIPLFGFGIIIDTSVQSEIQNRYDFLKSNLSNINDKYNFPIIALNWNNLEKQQTPFELLPGYIKK